MFDVVLLVRNGIGVIEIVVGNYLNPTEEITCLTQKKFDFLRWVGFDFEIDFAIGLLCFHVNLLGLFFFFFFFFLIKKSDFY
jgi:hypothetical protein